MENEHGVTQGKPIKGRVKHVQTIGGPNPPKMVGDCESLREGFTHKPATTVEQLQQLPSPTEQARRRRFRAHDVAQDWKGNRHGATIEWHARIFPATYSAPLGVFNLPDTEYGKGTILARNGEVFIVKFKGFYKSRNDYGERWNEYIPSETHAYQVTAVFPTKQDGGTPVNAVRLAEWPTTQPRR